MITLLLASLLLTPVAPAQAPAPPVIEIPAEEVVQELRLDDGSRIIGRVESIDGARFTFRTSSGALLTVETSTVLALKPLRGQIINGELWAEDSNPTRLFFAPTGRSLARGEAYVGVYQVFAPFVQVGITDRVSIGGGTPLLWLGSADRPYWFTPKAQVLRTKSTTASIGVMHFLNIDDASVGIAYGVVTRGSTDNAVTLGAGYAYAHTGDDGGGAPVGMIGGERRMTRRLKFVTENYIFKHGGFASGGVRFLGEKLSADIGFVVPFFADLDEFIVFPMVNIVRKF